MSWFTFAKNLQTMKTTLPILLWIICAALTTSAQTVYYVNQATGSDANTGASWSSSFRNVTRALEAANASAAPEVDIWIAEGIYTPIDGITPAPANASDTSFAFYRGNGIGKALKIYGGFAGTETSIGARTAGHITYLDGNTGAGNSYHVGVIADLQDAADSVILDGLYIRNGKAANSGTKIFNGAIIQQYFGGGLMIANNANQRIAIRNCVFDNNKTVSQSANGQGGAVYILYSWPVFEGCTFSNNVSSKDVTTSIVGNVYGGAIYAATSYVALNSCTFDNNLSLGAGANINTNAGGAIYFSHCDSGRLNYCHFTGNVARNVYNGFAYGGAVFTQYSNIRSIGCSFTGNQASDSGAVSAATICAGGAFYSKLSLTIYDSCTFNYNKVYSSNSYGGTVYDSMNSSYFVNSSIANSTVTANGGAFYNDAGSMIIVACDVHDNDAGNGGAIYSNNNASSIIGISNVHNNNAGLGGVVYNEASFLLMGIDSVQNNTAGVSGAVVYSTSGNIYLSASNMLNNSVPLGTAGAVYVRTTDITIDTCTFSGNTATNGGGIYMAEASKLNITRSVFTGNKASAAGGAILVQGSLTVPTDELFKCNGSIFLDNKSVTQGGAIAINSLATYSCADTLTNNLFIGNNAAGAGAYGGAIATLGSMHFIGNNTFLNDSATYGGAISSHGSAPAFKAINNIFSDCYATGTAQDTSIDATGSYVFTNNLYSTAVPLFVNAANPIGADGIWATADDGLMLQHCSPAVNAGSNSYLAGIPSPKDITGNTRIIGGTVDMGAYESVTVGIIEGHDTACVGTAITFTDTSLGGTWSSSNTAVVTIDPVTGVATMLAEGTSTISYHHASPCSIDIQTYIVTVVGMPVAATITGASGVCIGRSVTLTSSLTGGTWGNITANTIVDPSGVVLGVTAGIDTITYNTSNACGTAIAKHVITVYTTTQCDSASSVPAISGNANVLHIAPNPAHGSLNISLVSPLTENATVVLTNAMGIAVKEWTITTNKSNELVLDIVPPGIYLVTVSGNGVHYNSKVVIN